MPPTKPILACIRCSERKVGCNRQNPCSNCVRHNAQCVFREPRPSRKQQKGVRDELMAARLKHYEALLQEKGIDPNQVNHEHEPETHHDSIQAEILESLPLTSIASAAPVPHATHFEPQILQSPAGTKLASNSLWLRIAEEVHDDDETEEEEAAKDISEQEVLSHDFSHVLGFELPQSAASHPSFENIRCLWQTFLENVNPLTKLVHVPSLQPAIDKAIANINHIPKGFEALMFAIYGIAVRSLEDSECIDMLGETRGVLLTRYVAYTKSALLSARFMSSTSIVVLQALVLHIFTIRDIYEPRSVWILTGMAIRMAEGMGMHIDGKLLGLSPFETEIRRRIWWLLKVHDVNAAELCGQAKLRTLEVDESTPKQPTNVNDSDLHPTMREDAVDAVGATEMIWCLLKTELACFAANKKAKFRKSGSSGFGSEELSAMKISMEVKEMLYKEIQNLVETKYLRFCDPSQPLQMMALLVGRLIITSLGFVANHPRRWTKMDQVPAAERQLVWDTVIQLLEKYAMMQSTPLLRGFAWIVPYSIQWTAVIHVLDTLRADPTHVDAAKAWRLIDTLYEKNSDMLLAANRPIFVALGNLCLEAYNARAATLTRHNRPAAAASPEYITKLRELRSVAIARRQEAAARRNGKEILNGGKASVVTNNSMPRVDSNPVQESTWTEADAFWLGDAFEEGFVGNGMVNMTGFDTDGFLNEDLWLDPQSEPINWEQWDAWLGGSMFTNTRIGL
ncbi:hypothetical protein BX600DRAFT_502204 [Xylariales sp. PMI_506]|nr:hypothetical protein BX600DRAFT_502204 [Xylariales sp. PMI_506]